MPCLSQKALTVLHGWSFAILKSSTHYIVEKHNKNLGYTADIANTSAAPWDPPELACQSKQRINQVQQKIRCTVHCLFQQKHSWSSMAEAFQYPTSQNFTQQIQQTCQE